MFSLPSQEKQAPLFLLDDLPFILPKTLKQYIPRITTILRVEVLR